MGERLEVSQHAKGLGKEDQKILQLVGSEQLPIERVVALADAEPSETLSSIKRLIAVGCLQLLIIQQLWGIEFALQRSGSDYLRSQDKRPLIQTIHNANSISLTQLSYV